MENPVIQRLYHTPDTYEMMVMNMWFSWCSEKAKNHRQLQKLLTCTPLFNWWHAEMTKLEEQFINETRPHPDKAHIRKLYAEYMVEIFNLFSKPLIKLAYERDRD